MTTQKIINDKKNRENLRPHKRNIWLQVITLNIRKKSVQAYNITLSMSNTKT
jgi:hypothetical protein